MGARAEEEDDSDESLDRQSGEEDALAGEAAQEEDIHIVSADEAHPQHGEGAAEGFRAHMKAIHENDGRAGYERKEAGEGESSGKRVGEKLGMLEDPPEARDD